MCGQAGSRAALLRSTQRTQADRPGRTSGPTTPIASSACTTRCGTRCRIRSASTTGSGRPVSTARSGSRRPSSAVRTSRATRWTARATPADLLAPTSARPSPPGVMSAGPVVPLSMAAHPGDAGGGEERRDAGAHPPRAVDPRERGPAAGEHRRAAVAVPVGKRGAGQLGGDPLEQVPGEGGPQARREVVEHPGRGQQPDHPVHRVLADAVGPGGPRHLGGIARPVEQRHDRRGLAQPGQRAGAPRIDPDLQRVAVPPERPEPRLQCWSHAQIVTAGDRHSGHIGTLLRPSAAVGYAIDSAYWCRWRSRQVRRRDGGRRGARARRS